MAAKVVPDRESVFCRCAGPLAAEIGGEVVLMSVERGNYYGLDEIGSDIWRRLEQPLRVADLVTALAADYDGEVAVIERDVLDLLTKLLDNGLVEQR